MIRVILTSIGYHMYILYNLYLNLKGAASVKKMTSSWENSISRPLWINVKIYMLIQLYTLLQALIYNTEVYNWWSYVDVIIHIFSGNIFNFCIRCIWLNPTCIMPNFYLTTLLCDGAIGSTLCYHKCPVIWRLIFLCSVISEYDLISNFVVMVNSFTIFVDIIYINLRLLLMTY